MEPTITTLPKPKRVVRRPLPRIMFKACLRCHGDLMRMEDEYSESMKCLLCGREYEFVPGPTKGHAA